MNIIEMNILPINSIIFNKILSLEITKFILLYFS